MMNMVTIDQVQFTKVASPAVSRPEAPFLFLLKPISCILNACAKPWRRPVWMPWSSMPIKNMAIIFISSPGEPRFEKAALVVRLNGTPAMVLGSEMHKMYQFNRLAITPVLYPYFSLSNWPRKANAPCRKSGRKAAFRKETPLA